MGPSQVSLLLQLEAYFRTLDVNILLFQPLELHFEPISEPL